jgi:hypothetical protein
MSKLSMMIKCTSIRPNLSAVLTCQNDAENITRCRGSIAILEATGRHHWKSIPIVSHRRLTGCSKQNNNKKMYHICWLFRTVHLNDANKKSIVIVILL